MNNASSKWLASFAACGLVLATFGLANCGNGSGAMRTGTGGTGGRGGSTGAGGSAGSAGTGGTTGNGGGAGGSTVIPLSCSPGIDPTTTLLSDFSSSTWNATTGKWGTIGMLTGSKFNYVGPMGSTMTATVDSTAMNLVLMGSVAVSDYAGGGLSFDSCVNTSTHTGFKFTLGGTSDGCDVLFQVQTFSQQAQSNKGGCDSSISGNCYHFPQLKVQIGTDPITVHFSDLAGTGMPTDAAGIGHEMVGLQWQFQYPMQADGGTPQAACSGVNMTIDDVQFVDQ